MLYNDSHTTGENAMSNAICIPNDMLAAPKTPNDVTVGTHATYCVGSDRYPGKVIAVNRFANGNVKSVEVETYDFRSKAYDGYATEILWDQPRGTYTFAVATHGKNKGKLRGVYFGKADGYRDPHF